MVQRIFRRYPVKTQRFIEIIIPAFSWLLITFPLWLSFWHPAVVAYFIITFDIYWFFKSATLAYYAIRSYLTMVAHTRTDWFKEAKSIINWQDIHHVIIIPEYKEPYNILEQTISNLTKQTFPLKYISIILATESRDKDAVKISNLLKQKYGHKFGNFWITKHPILSGEIAGKSSNMAFAGHFAHKKCKQLGWNENLTTVTSADADAQLHPSYYSYLTFKFLTDLDLDYHFYQTGIMYYSNIWEVPLPIRVINTIGSMFSLSLLKQGKRLINYSTYSLSLKTVAEVGFWSVDIIPEDYHLFFKTYFAKGEKVRVIPIFLPTLVQAAQSSTLKKTLINQYEQQKRWAWGVSDLPNVIRNYFLHPEINIIDRTTRLLYVLETHIIWPTNWFILTLGSTLPTLVNPYFARTVLGHNLSQISSFILTISAVLLLIVIIVDTKTRPKRPAHFPRWKVPLLFVQWLSLPVVSFFLSALPGLDAHTRLMLGKRLEYRVTEKV